MPCRGMQRRGVRGARVKQYARLVDSDPLNHHHSTPAATTERPAPFVNETRLG